MRIQTSLKNTAWPTMVMLLVVVNALMFWKYQGALTSLNSLRGVVPSVQRQIELLEPTFYGETMRSFRILSLDAKWIDSESYLRRKEYTLIAAFGGGACNRCLSAIVPKLGEIFDSVGTRLNVLLALSPEQGTFVPHFRRTYSMQYDTAIDDSSRILGHLRLSAPALLLVNRHRKIVYCHVVDNMNEQRTFLFLNRISNLFANS